MKRNRENVADKTKRFMKSCRCGPNRRGNDTAEIKGKSYKLGGGVKEVNGELKKGRDE